jgi:RimJ/RimL family protein N-acetyltransferase
VVLDRGAWKASGADMILAGDRERVCAFVNAMVRDGTPITEKYEALGAIDKEGNLLGGFVFYDITRTPNGGNVMLAAAGSGPWLTRLNLRTWFEYPFNQLECHRITCIIAKSNTISRKIVERLGFVMEGCIRGSRDPGKDSILYGMLRDECKWIG